MDQSQRSERARLLEVASRAGVSASTVSLVLTNKAEKRRISQKTREIVMRAAEELNYAPNLLTRSLRQGRTSVISYFSSFRHREWGDLYMDRVSAAVETAGGRYGYDVLVHCNFNRSPREISQFLNGGLADGLLYFAPEPNDPLLALLRRSGLPVVLVGARDPQGQYSSSRDDVVQGMSLVADLLASSGHDRIGAMASVGDDVRDSDLRIGLLRRLLAERGFDVPDSAIGYSGMDPLPALRGLLASSTPPTALFCWQDWLAYKVLESCDELGIRVPDDIALVGYDGIHWPSTSKHICTSVEVDISTVVLEAMQILDHHISFPGSPAQERLIPVRLKEGSTISLPITSNGAINADTNP